MDLFRLTIHEATQLLRQHDIRAQELTHAILTRIQATDPAITVSRPNDNEPLKSPVDPLTNL